MLTLIGKITKELGIETHTLHMWEKRDWLGDVLKDPESNNQRAYTEEQVKRIRLIHETIQKQRENGIKRTDFEEVEEKLLETFGGEVTKRETEVMVHPNSFEQMVEMVALQNKMMLEMQQQIEKLQNKELPMPDYTEKIENIMTELAESKKRESDQQKIIQDMNEKLQKAVDFIIESEKKESERDSGGNKSIWKRFFG